MCLAVTQASFLLASSICLGHWIYRLLTHKGAMSTLFISHSSKDKPWAERVHQALSNGGYKCLFLDSHPDDGIHAGADWEQTLYQRLRQSRALVVLCSTNWLASPWCVAEAMMSRDRGKRVFLLAAADIADARQVNADGDRPVLRIPDFLKDVQMLTLAGRTEGETFEQLLKGLEREGLKQRDFKLPHRPYPGLRAFRESDAAVYFGRDTEIDEVIAILARRRRNNARGFIVILGASGCGKSSLARAGVLPRLRRTNSEDGGRAAWLIAPPVLAGKGLDGVSLSLAQAFKDAGMEKELATVRAEVDAAGDLCKLTRELLLAGDAPDGHVLLLLDQLEEVFATPEGSDARAMLRMLLEATSTPGSPLIVLATMRSDFLNNFQQFEGVTGRYEELTLDPIPRSTFATLIQGPADRFGLDLDAGLAERMSSETAYNDALPLLAFTLEKLYTACQPERRLTLGAYEQIGGVSGAIADTADAILREKGYDVLSDDDVRMRDLRRAFHALAQVGEAGQFTRRIARRTQLPKSGACEAILKRFEDARLLVADIDESGQPTLSVAHEALFRVWGRLNGWLRNDRKALALRTQIVDAAIVWEHANQSQSHAWAEARILDAVHEIEHSGVLLADVDQAHRAAVDAFLGPTDRDQLEKLPAMAAGEDASAESERYGDAWSLPLSHEARASVGVRLALLGDQREGVGLREDGVPDIDWIDIDGGDVTIEIREDERDANSAVIDRLTGTVNPFRIARYPVTIGQFEAFIEEGHAEDGWQLRPGLADLSADYPPPKHHARYENHPADNVSWLDAMAFCHWLSVRLGFEVRLPSEFEWQQAAIGGDPSCGYPWTCGSDPIWNPQAEPWRANTAESALGRSTAVGMYPDGASRDGIQDMAGCLWEWCLNKFDEPDSSAFSLTGRRVLRGGSWDSGRDRVRSTYRFRGFPDGRFLNVGFRVLCSSSL